MQRNDPPHSDQHESDPNEPLGPPEPGAPNDALRRLEQRLDRASEAAERLIAEAASKSAARAAGRPPPAGWQAPGGDERQDSDLLMQALGAVRELIPPELQRRLAEALRELLLALRALIDWYLERTDRHRAEPARVQDIPIA